MSQLKLFWRCAACIRAFPGRKNIELLLREMDLVAELSAVVLIAVRDCSVVA